MTRDALLAEALTLPREARAHLVRDLAASLDDTPAGPEVDAKWAAEVTRRLELYREGKLETETMEDAGSNLRRSLSERRG